MWGVEVWRAVVWWSLDNSTNFKNKWGFLPIVCEANQQKMKISRLDYTKPVLLPKELLSFGCCFVALALSYPCYSTWSGSILRLDKQFAAWSIILERLVLHSLVLVFVYTTFFQVFLSNDLQQPITNQTRAPRPTGFRHWQRPLITLPIFVCEEMIIPGSLWFIMIHLCTCIVSF